MNYDELAHRLEQELKIPQFKSQLDRNKDYSEEEYQQIKNDLISYYTNYVDNIEGFYPGMDIVEKDQTREE